MKYLVFLIVALTSCDLYAQSLLDTLRQPTANADIELLNQANQASQNSANAAAKRATLLQRRADELRSQVSRLENEVEKLRAEHDALKAAVVACRDQVASIIEMIEKKDYAAIVEPIQNLKDLYSKSLLPELLQKETTKDSATEVDQKPTAETDKKPTVETEKKAQVPDPVNTQSQSVAPQPQAPQPDVPQPSNATDK